MYVGIKCIDLHLCDRATGCDCCFKAVWERNRQADELVPPGGRDHGCEPWRCAGYLFLGKAVGSNVPKLHALSKPGIRLHWLDLVLHARRDGPTEFAQQASFRGGDEMGWFEHGSTIIVLAPRGVSLAPGILPGARIKAGAPLLQLPDPS